MTQGKANDGEKRCTSCKVYKKRSEFGETNAYADGLDIYCRICRRIKGRQTYDRNKDNYVQRHELYRETHREKIQASANERNKRTYATKGKARVAVAQALLKGELKRLPCEVCGEVQVDFHHTEGYDKQHYLIGVWLCRIHHHEVHVKLRRQQYDHAA